FYYVHEAADSQRPFYRAAYEHVFGTHSSGDCEFFFAGEDEKMRLSLLSGKKWIAFFVYHFQGKTTTDIYLKPVDQGTSATPIFLGIDYMLGMRFWGDKILAITDRGARNRRIVEIRLRENGEHEWVEVVPECDAPINNWLIVGDRMLISYMKDMTHTMRIIDFTGKEVGKFSVRKDETLRIIGGSETDDEVLFESESFAEPVAISRWSVANGHRRSWTRKCVPFNSANYTNTRISFTSKDGTKIPMHLVGRQDVLQK